jgi:formyl-CoA transferase
VARRVLELVGLGDDERLWSFAGRVEHREELDRVVGRWIAARPADEVIAAFEEAHAACAPVYDMADLAADAHVQAREGIVEVDDTPMQGLIAKLSATPGHIRWAGRPLGADQAEIEAELGEERR